MKCSHVVSVTFKPKPAHQSDFAALMQSVKQDLPQVEGCKSVRVLTTQDEAATFTLIEDWDSVEKHASHIEKVVASGVWADIEGMLAEPPISLSLIEL